MSQSYANLHSWTLEQLLSFIDHHNVVIPEFQRGFVWTQRDVRKLFDSLVKCYPIGTFVFWKTNQRIDSREIFGKENQTKGQKYFILDGQQRLFTIYYLMRQQKYANVDRLYESLYEKSHRKLFRYDRFQIVKEKNRNFALEYSKEFNKFDTSILEDILGVKYRFPVIMLDIDDYHKAIEIFTVINKTGTPISTEAYFLTATWSKKYNIGRLLHEWKAKMKEQKRTLVTQLDTITFIHALAIATQLRNTKRREKVRTDISQDQLMRLAEQISNDEIPDIYRIFKKVMKAVAAAMGYLSRNFQISIIQDLPYIQQVTVLSTFFLYRDEPNAKQDKEIRKWFWRSSLSRRYAGKDYTENMRKDPIRMMRLAKFGDELRDIDNIDITYNFLRNVDRKAGRSSLRNAVKLMLWQMTPRWINGEKIVRKDYESPERNKEDDHFYSRKFCLDRNISEEIADSILNMIFLGRQVNESKGKERPSRWLRKKIDEITPSEELVDKFFKTQALPFSSYRDLSEKEGRSDLNDKNEFARYFERFMKRRAEVFAGILNSLQNGKIFEE